MRETALIVNAGKQEREAMESFVSGADYHVLWANSDDEAMEVCRNYEGAIHLLVTDMESGGAAGWDLAQTAAKIRPGLIVMFVSRETVRRQAVEERLTPRVLGQVTQALAEVTQALARRAQESCRPN